MLARVFNTREHILALHFTFTFIRSQADAYKLQEPSPVTYVVANPLLALLTLI